MNVARSGSMLATPTLAKIAVSAAKAADKRAQTIQAGEADIGHGLHLLFMLVSA